MGSEDGNTYALNASTGAYLWSYYERNYHLSSRTVANGVVYLGTDKLYAFGLP